MAAILPTAYRARDRVEPTFLAQANHLRTTLDSRDHSHDVPDVTSIAYVLALGTAVGCGWSFDSRTYLELRPAHLLSFELGGLRARTSCPKLSRGAGRTVPRFSRGRSGSPEISQRDCQDAVRREHCTAASKPAGRRIEPPRDCRRLHFLRGWSHVEENEVFARGPGAGGPDGI